MRKQGGVLLLAVFAATLTFSPRFVDAQERRRVVLMDFDGTRSGSLRRSVRKLIERNHSVLPGSAYEKISRRRRLTKINPANIRRVCRDMGCDAVITGELRREGGGYVFVLKVREAIGGQVSKRIAMRLRRARISRKLQVGLKRRLLDAIDNLESVGVQEPSVGNDRLDRRSDRDFRDDSEDDSIRRREEEIAARRAKRDAAKTKGNRSRDDFRERDDFRDRDRDDRSLDRRDGRDSVDRRDRDFERSRDRREDPLDRDRVDLRSDRTAREVELVSTIDTEAQIGKDPRDYPILITLGGGIQQRDLVFNAREGLVGNEVPTPYVGSPVPSVSATAELYPLAFVSGTKSALRGFGFGLNFDRVLGLQIQSQQNGMNVTTTAVQQRIEAGIRYRFNFGDRETLPTLTASLYYGQLGFVIDRTNIALDVPDVNYTSVNPGLALRIPFTKSFAFQVEGKFLAVLSAGDIQLEQEYGSGVVTGGDGDAFLELKLFEHFLLRGGAHITFIGYAFEGNGAKTQRDATQGSDVGGAADRYLGGYLSLGYQY